MAGLKLLIAQIAIILIVARSMGALFRRLHQPQVIGEMVAGILLGPSLLGWLAPGAAAALFPAASLGALNALSQIGLLLFMFLIGLDLDLDEVRRLGGATLAISKVSIAAPFLLGYGLAYYLYSRLSDPGVPFTGFALFMSIAMSITAFPVLARILTERNLLRTPVGALTVTCAAVNDAAAWCILAAIVALIRSSSGTLPVRWVLAGLAAFALVMAFVLRPALRRYATTYEKHGALSHDQLALLFLLVLASGWVTESLGLHALFGGFLAGSVMPKHHGLTREIWQRIESLVVVFLLPLFFAFTGLRSSIFLIAGSRLWAYCALIIAFAILGKLGGSLVTARLYGLSWRDSAAIGVLMNTRGLVELVILNIGLDLGVISPTLFSIMVLMALVTTLMTTPLLALLKR